MMRLLVMDDCPPEQTTTLQLIQSFVRYARAHRTELQGNAVVAVFRALREAYPCRAEHGWILRGTPTLFGLALHRRCRRILALDPVLRAAGAVGRAKALRYDAFEAELARLAKHEVVSRMSNLLVRLQMPNTINATNPMPPNSTTSATKSYSSQCRLRMMFIPVSNRPLS